MSIWYVWNTVSNCNKTFWCECGLPQLYKRQMNEPLFFHISLAHIVLYVPHWLPWFSMYHTAATPCSGGACLVFACVIGGRVCQLTHMALMKSQHLHCYLGHVMCTCAVCCSCVSTANGMIYSVEVKQATYGSKIMCWLLCAIVDHERIVSVITAWGGQWTGLPHSSKTNGDHLIKDNLGRYYPKTFETAKGKKERRRCWGSNPGPLA